MHPRRDGKKTRKHGEFTTRRLAHQRDSQRHDRILEASRIARANGDAWIALDGYRFLVTPDSTRVLHAYYSFLAIVRTKKFGLRVAEVNMHSRGHVLLLGKDLPTIGLSRDLVVVYIAEVRTQDDDPVDWQWGSCSGIPEDRELRSVRDVLKDIPPEDLRA